MMNSKNDDLTKQRRPVMKIIEAARMLGVSYPTAHKWAQEGHLPTVKIGPKTFILREPFEAMLGDAR